MGLRERVRALHKELQINPPPPLTEATIEWANMPDGRSAIRTLIPGRCVYIIRRPMELIIDFRFVEDAGWPLYRELLEQEGPVIRRQYKEAHLEREFIKWIEILTGWKMP